MNITEKQWNTSLFHHKAKKKYILTHDNAISQDGKPMEDSPRMKMIHEDENFTLLIYEVRPEDAGNYACVAINNVGKATCTARLNVESECPATHIDS